MKTKNIFCTAAFFAAALLALGSCFSPYTGEDGMGTIVLGNGSSARAAAPSGINRYNVTLTGPNGQTMSQDITGLSGTFKVTPGEWEVVITGYNGSAIASKAVKTVTVQAGENTPADIRMGLYHEARTINDLSIGVLSAYDTSYAHWIEVIGTITISGSTLIMPPANLELTISSDGSGVLLEETGGSSAVLSMPNPSTVTLRNITLQNNSAGHTVAMSYASATLILERGARITRTGSTSIVNLNPGKLEMYAGSEIYGCSGAGAAGGVSIEGGTFDMYGGSIHDNSVTGTGGGVQVGNGTTFNMHGGSIYKNSAGTLGGGVYVEPSLATFTKSGGTVYGIGGSMANTAGSGAAAYYASTSTGIENTF